MAASRSNARKRSRGPSKRTRADRRTVDTRQAALFFGVVITLIAAVIGGAYYLTLDDDEGEKNTLSLDCYNPEHDITPNGTAQFVFVLENKAGDRNVAKLEITEKPGNWDVHLDPYMILQKGSRQLGILTVRAPEDVDSGRFTIKVSATSQSFKGKASHAGVEVKAKPRTSNRTVGSEDEIGVNYVGYLANGSIFDTSVESVAKNKKAPKTEKFKKNHEGRTDYSLYEFSVGNNIEGFDEGVIGMHLYETKIVIVPPDKGYKDDPSNDLYGKTLYFEITLEKFN